MGRAASATGVSATRTARYLRAAMFSALAMLAFAGGSAAQSQRAAPSASTAPANGELRWHQLTPAQQQALAPLAGEWDKLDAFRRSKWLAIGNRYPSMDPDAQLRMQERMREWLKLTPEQRRVARENFSRAKNVDRDRKSAQWEQYQQLPEEQKSKLAQDAATRKRVTTLPPPAAAGSASKPIAPIKSSPKPMLEQSVTPQAARQSALQPVPQPAQQDQH